MLAVVKMIIETASSRFTLLNQPTIIACCQTTGVACSLPFQKADVDIVDETDQTREMTTTVSQIILSCPN